MYLLKLVHGQIFKRWLKDQQNQKLSESLHSVQKTKQKNWNRMTDKIQTQKGSNERLFIITQTHSMQIFREIPFIKPQNNT